MTNDATNGVNSVSDLNATVSDARPRITQSKWLGVLNAFYAAVIVAILLCNMIGPERWWFIAFNMYVPQAIWLAPGIILLLLTLIRNWRMVWIPLAVMAVVAGPLMGLVVHAPSASITRGKNVFLRVMTYNVKWGHENARAIAADIQKYNPDVVVMQDSGGVLQTAVGRQIIQWNVQTDGQYTVAVKPDLPVSALEYVNISFQGSNHHAIRFRLLVKGVEVTLYTAHLLSPREGLSNLRHHHIKPMERNVADRLLEGQMLAANYQQDQISDPAPAIVMGDLNSPPPSLVIRYLNHAGLRDAFSEAGSGYGYSYGGLGIVGTPYIRIDHIMVNKYLRVSKCWVGNSIGSDHSPVIADIVKAS